MGIARLMIRCPKCNEEKSAEVQVMRLLRRATDHCRSGARKREAQDGHADL